MVGWSRRSAESSERKRQWWASLTEEEREIVSFVSAVKSPWEWFLVFCAALVFALTFAALIALAPVKP